MRRLVSLAMLSASFFTFANATHASKTVCFTESLPVNDPDIVILPQREVYLTNVSPGEYTMKLVTLGQISEEMPCVLSPEFGFGLALECGDESIMIDFANMNGNIQKGPTETTSYGMQVMLCRSMSDLLVGN